MKWVKNLETQFLKDKKKICSTNIEKAHLDLILVNASAWLNGEKYRISTKKNYSKNYIRFIHQIDEYIKLLRCIEKLMFFSVIQINYLSGFKTSNKQNKKKFNKN